MQSNYSFVGIHRKLRFGPSSLSPCINACSSCNDPCFLKSARYAAPTNILFTGMCTAPQESVTNLYRLANRGNHAQRKRVDALSLTRYPTAPMTVNPTPTAWQILRNSVRSAVTIAKSAHTRPSLKNLSS
jgi:hypothetical protein